MLKLTSSQIKDLKKQKREHSNLLFLDNVKIIKDTLSKGAKPQFVLVEDESLLSEIGINSDSAYKVDHKTVEMLSDSRTPQGVICVIEYAQKAAKPPRGNFLVLDGIQDPGNAGSLIRTACACGFDCVFMLDSVHVTNSKLVRSSVGTIFNINIYEMTHVEFISFAQKHKLNLLKADMDGENVFNSHFKGDVGVVVGNEGQGVSDEISKICAHSVSIPMSGKVESLNAAISGSIIMYQIAKDRLKV